MKKVLIIVGVLLLIGLVLFFFLGNGKEKVSDFFNPDADFGSFFDVDPQSQNDFVPPTQVATATPSTPGSYVAPVLRQISFEPISGYAFYSTTSTSTRTVSNSQAGDLVEEFLATSTVVRFQERATGHVYDVFEFIEAPVKVSNITVQKIYKTLFSNEKNQFLEIAASPDNEQITTALARIIPATANPVTGTTTEQSLAQDQISGTLNELVYLGNSNRILYSRKAGTGSQILVSDLARSTETVLAELPFYEYTLEPINNTLILLQTKASANIPGYAYTLDLTTRAMDKVAGNINGLLLKVSPDSRYYLYSQSNQGSLTIRSYDTTTETVRVIGLDTIPEKCVFSRLDSAQMYCFGSSAYKSATYPDDWYMGKVFNEENLYRINLVTGDVRAIYMLDQETSDFDITNPALTANDEQILFQNKYDLTLWALDLAALNNQF